MKKLTLAERRAGRANAERDGREYGEDDVRYSGTLAAKAGFRMARPESGEALRDFIQRCLSDLDHWASRKWGPAACVDAGPDPERPGCRIFVFFGFAPE